MKLNIKIIVRDILFLIAVNLAFFFRPIFVNKFMFSTAEMLSEGFGMYRYIGDVLHSGAFPLWDPYHYFPFASLIFPAVFYPFNIIGSFFSSLFDFNTGFYIIQIMAILHILFASIFMYAFLRNFKINEAGSLLGGIIFAYSGFVIIGAQSIYYIQSIAWFPLLMLFFFKGILNSKRKSHCFALAGIFLALCLLGGFITVTLYMFAVLGFCALWFCMRSASKSEKLTQIILPLKGLLITYVVAIGIAAIQLLPTYEYFNASVRKGIGYDLITQWGSTPAFHFINFFIPHFFGGAGAKDWAWQVLNVGFYVFFYYASVIAILLLIFSIFIKVRDNILREIYLFLFFLAVLSLFLIMGNKNAVFGWLYSLPMLPVTRIPTRWAFFLDFSIAALAGISFSLITSSLSKETELNLKGVFNKFIRPIAIWLPLSILPIVGALVFKKHFASIERIVYFIIFFYCLVAFLFMRLFRKFKRSFIFIFIIIVCLDLFIANVKTNPCAPALQPPEAPSKNFQNNLVIQALKSDKDIFRVSGLQWPINSGQANQIFTLGYMGGFHFSRFGDFRGQNNPQGSGSYSWFELKTDPSSQLIDFYNIKYLVDKYDLAKMCPHKYEPVVGFIGNQSVKFVGLFRNKNVFPRAFFVTEYVTMPDSKEILKRMEEIDLSKKVILEEDPGFTSYSQTQQVGADVKITNYQTQEIELEARVKGDGLLVMSEIYYPGWHAYVDGKEVKIFRANYVFRAIKLTPGNHHVKFAYSPKSVKIGLLITILSVIALILMFSFRMYTKK